MATSDIRKLIEEQRKSVQQALDSLRRPPESPPSDGGDVSPFLRAFEARRAAQTQSPASTIPQQTAPLDRPIDVPTVVTPGLRPEGVRNVRAQLLDEARLESERAVAAESLRMERARLAEAIRAAKTGEAQKDTELELMAEAAEREERRLDVETTLKQLEIEGQLTGAQVDAISSQLDRESREHTAEIGAEATLGAASIGAASRERVAAMTMESQNSLARLQHRLGLISAGVEHGFSEMAKASSQRIDEDSAVFKAVLESEIDALRRQTEEEALPTFDVQALQGALDGLQSQFAAGELDLDDYQEGVARLMNILEHGFPVATQELIDRVGAATTQTAAANKEAAKLREQVAQLEEDLKALQEEQREEQREKRVRPELRRLHRRDSPSPERYPSPHVPW